ncbi:hypothetical protein G9A89_013853 [Geosiphon pyriformis]|nr:hypothetical protein G9A89_013853 [Geosiphon pyriformis]
MILNAIKNLITTTTTRFQNLIVINLPPAPPIAKQQQQSQPLPQQQIQQQPQQQPMAYALIAKIKKFTGKENDAQVWLNDIEKAIAANGWNNDRALQNLSTGYTQNPNAQQYLSLLVTPEDVSSNNQEPKQKQPLTSNILPAIISNDKSLAAIFPFELEETTPVLLFNRATLNTKLIIFMYTNAKVDGHAIKLILDNGSAKSIITQQLMD